jgi:3-oxoacyl-[acyl-carrier-protein] synthase II
VNETRLWVTGIGLVTALGTTREATWDRLVRGERAIEPITLFDTTGQRVALAAEVRGVEVPRAEDDAIAWSRTSAMALAAAREALDAARLDTRATRVGLVVGGTTAGMFETEALLARLHADPQARDALREMLSHPLTSTGDALERKIGPFVRVRALSSACSSGANAIVAAAIWLLAGEVDAVVAGGSDGLCRLTLSGFNALGAIDPEPCRPFDRRRRGMSLGEGAGFVVLERAEGARVRGVEPVAELAGWAIGSEAHHITNPEPGGVLVGALLARAMSRAGLDPSTIDYVNAHGTGTPLNDPMEASALACALGREIDRVPVSSSKGQMGHTLGAAGAIEAALAAMAVARQTIVPTAGLDDPDPALGPLVHVPHVGRKARVRAALSNAFGFGGMDSVLVVGEPELGPPQLRDRRSVVVTGAAAWTERGLARAREAPALVEGDGPRAPLDPDARLDDARARRLDRPARLGAVVAARALEDAGLGPGADAGVILGSAFGSVDASAAFMHRIGEKGARFASPAEFPNLVPSSPVGHVSIYLGLAGPTFATADLATSGESAIAQAAQLIAGGEASRIVAGAAELKSSIVERVLGVLFARSPGQVGARRGEMSAAIVLEAEDAARARGAEILARVTAVREWRDAESAPLAGLEPPRDAKRAEVVLPHGNGDVEAVLGGSGWAACARRECATACGAGDGLGAVAAAVAVGLLATGSDEVLVIGLTKGRGYALALARP